MKKVTIRDDYIKLGQCLKLAGVIGSGSEAKEEIENGEVKVNGEEECRRGRKIREGDVIEYREERIIVEGKSEGSRKK